MWAVLALASNSDPKLLDKIRSDLAQEYDPVIRGALIEALTAVRDPKLHHAILEALLAEPSLTPDELAGIWAMPLDPEARADSEAFLREHFAEVMKRLPQTETLFSLPLSTMHTFTEACGPERRDEIAAYVTKHYGPVPASARPIAQAIEQMDICIARKKLLEPSLRAWLTGKP